MQKRALICGAGGFIGNHMVNRLKEEGYWVRGVDLKYPEFSHTKADHFVRMDLRDSMEVDEIIGFAGSCRNPYKTWSRQFDKSFDEIYQFAADMGGAGYIFTGAHDADVMHNSASINLNVLNALTKHNSENGANRTRIFYSSSACIYPAENQTDPLNPNCQEDSAYPANPDSEYGWEKLFSERLYGAYTRNYGVDARIARFHNIYGPLGTWQGGREKAPAAICRKVIEAEDGGSIDIWGDGEQTRSFLYIDDCIDAVRLLMQSTYMKPINIGSEEMVTINQLVDVASSIERKTLQKNHIPGPLGVRGRNSDNTIIRNVLGWNPKFTLQSGIERTYDWIKNEKNPRSSKSA